MEMITGTAMTLAEAAIGDPSEPTISRFFWFDYGQEEKERFFLFLFISYDIVFYVGCSIYVFNNTAAVRAKIIVNDSIAVGLIWRQ